MVKKSGIILTVLILTTLITAARTKISISESPEQLKQLIVNVNDYWQQNNKAEMTSFWDVAAYHTGNMAAYGITNKLEYLDYSLRWAEHNNWKGAISNDKSNWKYSYGEKPEYVLFGDWQICFQTYIDLYEMRKDSIRIARTLEVINYQMQTPKNDYWWWADGLYMVMPVFAKLHRLTNDKQYSEKLYEYFCFADSLMFDAAEGLYFRDGRYVYPKHKTLSGKKDFWARGDGWVFAAFAKILTDLPKNDPHRAFYIKRYKAMAEALAACQQPEGHWTRSLLDPAQAPGYETSGTAFFTYGFLWGINNGILKHARYAKTVQKSWSYLTKTALQPSGKIGYVQPIGERAIPGQVVDLNSTANFGVGAFLLAASEMYKNQKK